MICFGGFGKRTMSSCPCLDEMLKSSNCTWSGLGYGLNSFQKTPILYTNGADSDGSYAIASFITLHCQGSLVAPWTISESPVSTSSWLCISDDKYLLRFFLRWSSAVWFLGLFLTYLAYLPLIGLFPLGVVIAVVTWPTVFFGVSRWALILQVIWSPFSFVVLYYGLRFGVAIPLPNGTQLGDLIWNFFSLPERAVIEWKSLGGSVFTLLPATVATFGGYFKICEFYASFLERKSFWMSFGILFLPLIVPFAWFIWLLAISLVS